jgi:methionyl-tRNA formyltransferase
MYPHIFSIINGLPTGATIHEVDEFIDNGDIIAQQEVEIFMYDDSKSLHERIMKLEMGLFESHFEEILLGTYTKKKPQAEGNINYKKDFSKLCSIDLENHDSFENHINILKALSYGSYKNAYFHDKNGNKIYIRVELSKNNSEK